MMHQIDQDHDSEDEGIEDYKIGGTHHIIRERISPHPHWRNIDAKICHHPKIGLGSFLFSMVGQGLQI